MPTLNYFSTQSPDKLRHFSYRGTKFVCLCQSRSPPTLSTSPAQHLLSVVTAVALASPKFLEMQKQVMIACCQVRTILRMFENVQLEQFARPLLSLSCTIVLPPLNNRHHFLTFPSFIWPSPTLQQSACVRPPYEHF